MAPGLVLVLGLGATGILAVNRVGEPLDDAQRAWQVRAAAERIDTALTSSASSTQWDAVTRLLGEELERVGADPHAAGAAEEGLRRGLLELRDALERTARGASGPDLSEALGPAVRRMRDSAERELAGSLGSARASLAAARYWMGVATAVALGLAVVVVLVFSRRMREPLVAVADAVRALAAGDLRESEALARLASSRGEIGELSRTLSSVGGELRAMIARVRDSISGLSTSATAIVESAQQASVQASQQAATVTQVTTTTEEILQTSKAAAVSAGDVVRTSEQAVERGNTGLGAIEDAYQVVDLVNERVSEIASRILQLSEQNNQIGDIVETVNDLAEQSNLLAVNASIEASKAGEQGRSFAVVAGEVRNLAEQSKRSTEQIRGILEDIQRATQSAVMATEEGNKRAEDGRRAIESVRSVIGELAAVLEENSDKARQIAGAASQQTSGVQEISRAMESVSTAGSETATNARGLEASAQELSRLAADLELATARYTL